MKPIKYRVYFAHPMCTYNSIHEEYILEWFKQFPDVEVVNPNTPEHQEGCKTEGMSYFKPIVLSCDRLYAYGFGDNTIGAGVAQEMDWMQEKGGNVIFVSFHSGSTFERMVTETAAQQFKVLSVEETRAKLKSYELKDRKRITELQTALEWSNSRLKSLSEGKPITDLNECIFHSDLLLNSIKI